MITTLEYLHLLKDASKQNKVFKSFLNKYRNIFNSIINIQYSDKKYNCINVEEIFYKDFLTYTIHQLEKSDSTNESVDSWVPVLARNRAIDISAKVTKSYAKHLLETGGSENWRAFNATLMDEAFSRVTRNVVARYFDNPKYKGYFNDIRISLLYQQYEDRAGNPPTPRKPIENIDSYVYKMLSNFALKKKVRESIDAELGLEDGREDISKYDRSDAEEFDGLDDELHNSYTDDEGEINDDNHLYDDEFEDDNETTEELIDSPDDKRLAEQMIEELLNLMPRKDQAELLRKVMLYGYDRVELAKEMGCTRAVLDTKVSCAMMVLYKAALPHIRYRCKHMVMTNIDMLTNEHQKEILKNFFLSNKTLEELAQAYGKKESEFSADLIKAYKKVKSISAKTKKEYVTDTDINRYNEEVRNEEAKSSLRTTKLTTLKI